MPRKKAVKVRKWVTCAEPGCKRRAGTSKPYCGEHQKQFEKKANVATAKRKRVADGKVVKEKSRRERKEDARKETRKNRAGKKAISKLSRLIKAYCEKCGYTIRLSRKWIDIRRPMCPVCMHNMATAIDGEPNVDPRQLNLKEARRGSPAHKEEVRTQIARRKGMIVGGGV